EAVELGRPQRSQAGRAEHMDTMFHHPHDFLVPHRGDVVEVAVDDADGPRVAPAEPVDIPGGGRREVDGVEFGPCVLLRERRPEEDVDLAHQPPISSVARWPRRHSGTVVTGPSSPGTMTRTTGMPKSSWVRSTRTTSLMPAERTAASSQATSASKLSPSNAGTAVKSRAASPSRSAA